MVVFQVVEGPVLSSKVEVREGSVSSPRVVLSSVVQVKEGPKESPRVLSSIVEVKEAVSVAPPRVLSSVVQVRPSLEDLQLLQPVEIRRDPSSVSVQHEPLWHGVLLASYCQATQVSVGLPTFMLCCCTVPLDALLSISPHSEHTFVVSELLNTIICKPEKRYIIINVRVYNFCLNLQVLGGEPTPPPKVSVLSSSHEEPAISGNNLVIGPEYDFLSRQPSEVVDETFKVRIFCLSCSY